MEGHEKTQAKQCTHFDEHASSPLEQRRYGHLRLQAESTLGKDGLFMPSPGVFTARQRAYRRSPCVNTAVPTLAPNSEAAGAMPNGCFCCHRRQKIRSYTVKHIVYRSFARLARVQWHICAQTQVMGKASMIWPMERTVNHWATTSCAPASLKSMGCCGCWAKT